MRFPGLVAALIVAGCLLAGLVAASGALWYRTADFQCLHEGARLTALGMDPYDEQLWRPITTATFPDPFRGSAVSSCEARYAYPLWTAVAMLPFGALPLEVAASLWMALAVGGTVLGMKWIWAAAGGSPRYALLFATLVVMSQPFWVLLIGGQPTGLLLGLLGAAMLLAARRQAAASGAAVTALLLKPQIAGVFVPAYLLREGLRRPRTIIGAGAAISALIGISVAVRPDWIAGWLDELGGLRRLGRIGVLPSAWGFSNDLFGSPMWAPLLIAATVAVVLAIVRGRMLDHVSFAAIALPLSLLAMPHVYSYDFLVLALSWGTALVMADRMTGSRRHFVVGLTVIAATALPWSLYAVGLSRGQETLSALVPFSAALLVSGAVALAPDRG